MGKNLTLKVVLIIVLVAVAALTLYPPSKTLKPGIDLAGGTSLIYEIDTQGLQEEEQKNLAQRMITVLRRRIDPANIQNLIWRPQGNTRFEIQMPLASAEARDKRQNFEKALSKLTAKNVNRAKIMRSLAKPSQQRTEYFHDLAQGDPNRLTILLELAKAYDQRKELQVKRDRLDGKLKTAADKISSAGLDLDRIELNRGDWAKLNEQQLQETLKKFLGSESIPGEVSDPNLELLAGYTKIFAEWANVVDQLLEKKSQYDEAKRQLDRLNLTAEQIDVVLEMAAKSKERKQRIEQLKADFPDRATEIDQVVAAFDEYLPFRGRLDDPKDLQRMLKGAGILEFRILPTLDQLDLAELTPDEVEAYSQSLTEKGPKYASDNRYVWLEIENIEEWKVPNSIVAPFGDKYYVLASNKPNETMLHSPNKRDWKLEKAAPGNDEYGRRAIDFVLDERGGTLIAKVSG
ncbi:MAG: hypothetical protein ACE5NM_10690, partial [Sedimentisphaerales bacterium]